MDPRTEEKALRERETNAGKAASRRGATTPVEAFATFPLADRAQTESITQEAMPAVEDVRSVKEFGDENEK